MYRRPHELKKARYVACMEHRAEAFRIARPTSAQLESLKLGRTKGDNHRTGYKHRLESKLKASESHKKYWRENPDKAAERGQKIQGKNHYRWNDGSTVLNTAIRGLTEYRKWAKMVKDRDANKCTECNATSNLESHHIVQLNEIVINNHITNVQEARECKELWDITNGITLCIKCHYKIHGRNDANK